MKTADLVRALESVPEKRLALVDLVKAHTTPDGRIDTEGLLPLSAEVDMAIKEAEAYAQGVHRLLEELQWLMRP